MSCPKTNELKELLEQVELMAKLKTEYGAAGVSSILSESRKSLRSSLAKAVCGKSHPFKGNR